MEVQKGRAKSQADAKRFGEWLSGELERREWSANKLAGKVGKSHSTVGRWLEGFSLPEIGSIRDVAQALNVPFETVAHHAGYELQPPTETLQRFPVIAIPVVPWDAAAGRKYTPVIDYYYTMPNSKMVGPEVFSVRVKGTCMEPDIKDGDILVVNGELHPNPGDVVLVRIGEEVICKRLKHQNGHLILEADNGEEVKVDGEAQLIGKVVFIGREIG